MVPRYLLWLKVRVEEALLMKLKPNWLNYTVGEQSSHLVLFYSCPNFLSSNSSFLQIRTEALQLYVDPLWHSSLASTWQKHEWDAFWSILRTRLKVAQLLLNSIIFMGEMWENIFLNSSGQPLQKKIFSSFHILFYSVGKCLSLLTAKLLCKYLHCFSWVKTVI